MDKGETERPGRHLSRYRKFKRKPVEIVIIAFGIVVRVDEGDSRHERIIEVKKSEIERDQKSLVRWLAEMLIR